MRQMQVFSLLHEERKQQERLRNAGKYAFTCATRDIPEGEKVAVLGAAFGDVCTAVLSFNCYVGDASDDSLLTELVHIAAVAVAWLEALDMPGEDDI